MNTDFFAELIPKATSNGASPDVKVNNEDSVLPIDTSNDKTGRGALSQTMHTLAQPSGSPMVSSSSHFVGLERISCHEAPLSLSSGIIADRSHHSKSFPPPSLRSCLGSVLLLEEFRPLKQTQIPSLQSDN